MAQILAERIGGIPGLSITQKVESNGVFVTIPHTVAEKLREHYFFYPWNEAKSEYRLMTSWDTRESDITGFAGEMEKLMDDFNRS
jgi:threonine aldolase